MIFFRFPRELNLELPGTFLAVDNSVKPLKGLLNRGKRVYVYLREKGMEKMDTAHVCGNNITEAGEACDGTDLGGITRASLLSFKSGTLRCKIDCSGYDLPQCVKGNTIAAASCGQNMCKRP